jgi:hypothetical protein
VHPSAMFFVKELSTAKVATIMRALKQLFHNWPRSLSPLSDVYEGI